MPKTLKAREKDADLAEHRVLWETILRTYCPQNVVQEFESLSNDAQQRMLDAVCGMCDSLLEDAFMSRLANLEPGVERIICFLFSI